MLGRCRYEFGRTPICNAITWMLQTAVTRWIVDRDHHVDTWWHYITQVAVDLSHLRYWERERDYDTPLLQST